MPAIANTSNKESKRFDTVKSTKISALIADLNNHDGLVRQKARNELIKIGEPAVETLIQAFNSREGYTHWEAAKALRQIGSPKAARALVKALENDQFSVRWLAAEGLISLGRNGLEPLLHALEYKANSVWLREGAHHVLHDLLSYNTLLESSLKSALKPTLTALDEIEPTITVPRAAHKALQDLRHF